MSLHQPVDTRLSDGALMVLFANGDPGAARALTERLLPRALSHAARVLGDRAEAEDVAQEAMMRSGARRAIGGKMAGRSLRHGFTAWWRTCASTGCSAGDGSTRWTILIWPPMARPGLSSRMVEADRMAALDAALASLPERQRQAVVLRHIEGLSNPEIAAILDVGVEAVESLTARGKRALGAALAGRKEALGYDD